jgi:hypothetical protein
MTAVVTLETACPISSPRFEVMTSRETNTIYEPHFDGREMAMVHDMLRREIALLPGLMAAVAAG